MHPRPTHVARGACRACMPQWLDKVPLAPLTAAAVLLGLSPSLSEPHLLQQLKLLFAGGLDSVDLFDLALHASLPVVLVMKLLRLWELDRHPRR